MIFGLYTISLGIALITPYIKIAKSITNVQKNFLVTLKRSNIDNNGIVMHKYFRACSEKKTKFILFTFVSTIKNDSKKVNTTNIQKEDT